MPYSARRPIFRPWLYSRERAKFLWTVSLLFLLGLYLSAWPWNIWGPFYGWARLPLIMQNILPKIGDALMIAQIIAITVDQAAKRQLLGEFARDISTHIIGRALPTDLRDYIEKYLEADLVRANWRITYTITEIPSRPGYEKLITLSEYEMHNRTGMPRPYLFAYEVEEFPEIGTATITRCTGQCTANDDPVLFDHPDVRARSIPGRTA